MVALNKAIFLDRDGTVIVDKNYLNNIDDVELMDGAGPALAQLSKSGYLLVIITNQSGIGRGYFDKHCVDAQHDRLSELLSEFDVEIASFRYCPHIPEDDCLCRKPHPKLILDVAEELCIDCKQSFMMGDKDCDIMAGKNAECQTIFIGQGTHNNATYSTKNITEAAKSVLNLN